MPPKDNNKNDSAQYLRNEMWGRWADGNRATFLLTLAAIGCVVGLLISATHLVFVGQWKLAVLGVIAMFVGYKIIHILHIPYAKIDSLHVKMRSEFIHSQTDVVSMKMRAVMFIRPLLFPFSYAVWGMFVMYVFMHDTPDNIIISALILSSVASVGGSIIMCFIQCEKHRRTAFFFDIVVFYFIYVLLAYVYSWKTPVALAIQQIAVLMYWGIGFYYMTVNEFIRKKILKVIEKIHKN